MDERILMAVIAVLIVFVIASIVIGIINISKINSILDYSDDGNLIDALEKYYNNISDMQKKLKLSREGAMSERISACETKVNMGLSKTGIVNFDAFDDVHGNQSFALAVLNQYNDGFVITSLYGNSSSNTYVRTVREGRSTTVLLDEEREAIQMAMSGGNIS
ncbi:MAG: DUF4446 family protein [Oscillospiraceae bacterium]|nr:DUF4446 family protein [Oscillospiraceae bacterium]